MTKKIFFIIFGSLLSLILLIYILNGLDWQAFFQAIKTISLPEVFLGGMIIIINIAIRSLRWNLVAKLGLDKFKSFWQAANIGYLANIIYPARTGEVLKVIAINKFAPLVFGRAVSSAIIDRMLDMIVVGIFTLIVIWIHGNRIDPNIGKTVIAVFILATLVLSLSVIFVDAIKKRVEIWQFKAKWQQKLHELFMHGLEGIQIFRQSKNILIVLILTLSVFLFDYFWMWKIMGAFGWDLPFEAGLTVGVFLLLSISIPSAPGFIGVYQMACVLALGLYGIDQTLAVAYSIVLQLITFTIMGIQGMLVTAYCGFNLSQKD
ncbi:lysylphosphatidylglycerol synthase transmembrane domain-containing protein [Candidatus Marithrix sp. Canyon 246]|uniref:lysylphosphatidylglycerol synthase transmembrane domain-containing protein n=1 Tax=Candidatus Marithrix sp. Canyon 246 TaxID=1827136 RepID=UPI00084A2812|nr:lysylphosphatidylglycerol synthase transmembrane domain-containing protein [Candidatus Marithrix sp. Canyon 246]